MTWEMLCQKKTDNNNDNNDNKNSDNWLIIFIINANNPKLS
jgi:hypothetical protein